MLTTFLNTTNMEVFSEAIKIAGYDEIRDTFIAQLSASESFTNEQKLAVKLAGKSMNNPGDYEATQNRILMQVLNISWDDVDAGGVTPLLPEQRAGIIDGIMAVCKGIINAECDRLEQLTQLDTDLPEDWNTPDPEEEPEPEQESA